MKKICMILGLFGFVALFSSATIAQQKIGKVFGRTEANTLFGKVYGHESITLDQLKEAVKNAGDYIYITIKHNQPIFTNEKRQSLIKNIYVPHLTKDEKMIVFSKSAVEEFLSKVASGSGAEVTASPKGNMSTTASTTTVDVERRGEVTSLSSGAYTLEYSSECPPMCP